MLFKDNKNQKYSIGSLLLIRTTLLLGFIALTGCVTSTGVSAPPTIPGQEQGQTEVPSLENAPSENRPSENRPDDNRQVSSRGVIDELISEGRRALSNKKPMLAIEQAERGIRVDRTEPELYLLLAQAYQYLGDGLKAANFARQGLRYVSSGQFLLRQKLQKFTQN
jgi:hypothetical protein